MFISSHQRWQQQASNPLSQVVLFQSFVAHSISFCGRESKYCWWQPSNLVLLFSARCQWQLTSYREQPRRTDEARAARISRALARSLPPRPRSQQCSAAITLALAERHTGGGIGLGRAQNISFPRHEWWDGRSAYAEMRHVHLKDRQLATP